MKVTVFIFALMILIGRAVFAAPLEVVIQPKGSEQYDISIGGQLFTSYHWNDTDFFDKPIFWPVLAQNGQPVTRSFPMVKDVPEEAKDHPHHQALFFTYDEVNGIHYWNMDRSGRRIKHREASVDGNRLKLLLDWNDKEGKTVLVEHRTVTFGGGVHDRWMDHDITLAAQNADVEFGDSKEGAFGLRLTRTMQETGGYGKYINAEGLEKSSNVWGKPSAWVAIRGIVQGASGPEPATVAIFSHPTSLNHPPYWHARDYGLFTANPFGRKAYDKSAEERKTVLKASDNLHLRYRVTVYGGGVDKALLDKDYAEYSK